MPKVPKKRTPREEAHELLDIIFDIRDDAHFANEASECHRVPEAQRATRLFWMIYEASLSWVEDVHRGHYLYTNDPKVKELAHRFLAEQGANRDDDDWVWEVIGSLTRLNSHTGESFRSSILDELAEYCLDDYDDIPMDRHVMFEMTQSSTGSSIWPELLHHSTLALQFGGTPALFKQKTFRHGDPWQMLWAKRETVNRVLFLVGKGSSKTSARAQIGGQVGVSEHSLKKWEAEIRSNGFLDFLCDCASLAGEWSGWLDVPGGLTELEQELGPDHPAHNRMYGLSYLEAATSMHKSLREDQPADLRRLIRQARLRETR